MKGMNIKCPAQGYAVWKNVMMAALHRGVNVPGLKFLNPKSAAPESTATAKLIEFEGTLTQRGMPAGDASAGSEFALLSALSAAR